MSDQIVSALAAVASHLVDRAKEDAELRDRLRQLAQAVLEATEHRNDAPVVSLDQPTALDHKPAPGSSDNGGTAGTVRPIRIVTPAPRQEPLPKLTLGQPRPIAESQVPSYADHWSGTTDADLPLIEARCRLKAEGARWAARRRRLISEGAAFDTEIAPLDREIISRAKEIPDCFLWMCHPSGPSPSDSRLYEVVAGCFETLADAVALLRQILDDSDLRKSQFEQSLDLLAEAQSALRAAVGDIDGQADHDQTKIFLWLKLAASENQIFIQRFMRVDDPADPTKWEDLSSRIEAIDGAIQESRKRTKQQRKLLGKIRHKLSLIEQDPEDADEHWEMLVGFVEELVSDGMPPSNRELRDILVPAVDSLPELPELPHGFQLVLREIDRYLANCPHSEAAPAVPPTREVREVARLLHGRAMVLIGGDRRPGSERALHDAFHLSDLYWMDTREHQSIAEFEPYVARPEVAVVVLAIRWSSHSFGDVREFCERYEKPLVRLPAGYNPNQVAVQILSQCSERLKDG